MPYKDPEKRKEASVQSWERWSKRNPKEAAARARVWRVKNPEYMLHKAAERRAKRDGTLFEITREDIPQIPEICPIALIPLFVRDDGGQGPCDNSPTLDRIDPTLGYVKTNIRVISHRGNRWKNNMTKEDVQRVLDYMNGSL